MSEFLDILAACVLAFSFIGVVMVIIATVFWFPILSLGLFIFIVIPWAIGRALAARERGEW